MTMRRMLLLPLTPIYTAVVRWKRVQYTKGRRTPQRLAQAVISVGSVSAGGAGKTPFVLMLADVLGRREYAVRILTRGYRRESREVERVDPEGDARRFGDEPMLLARRSRAPVYVGADRYAAGLLAEKEPARGLVIHLLDDGFQHRRLARELDIVLLTQRDVEGELLPAGDLREPLSALSEADVIVVREEESEALHAFLISRVWSRGEAPPIWLIRRSLEFGVGGGSLPKRLVAFCGIARPEGFTRMLEERGVRPTGVVTFRDHHRYVEEDVTRLIAEARRIGADGLVTTEKDAVKLTREMRERLEEIGPLVVAELRVELVDERGVMEQMISMVPRLDRRRNR